MNCPQCNFAIPEGRRFCTNCGYSLSELSHPTFKYVDTARLYERSREELARTMRLITERKLKSVYSDDNWYNVLYTRSDQPKPLELIQRMHDIMDNENASYARNSEINSTVGCMWCSGVGYDGNGLKHSDDCVLILARKLL